MDKIELNQADLQLLLEWRGQNVELVRSMPAPLKAVELVMKHNNLRIKGFRDGRSLKLHLSDGRNTLLNVESELDRWGRLIHKKGKNLLDKDSFQSVLTVYCSLMALIAYSRPVVSEEPPPSHSKPHQKHNGAPSRPKQQTTYIIRKVNGRILAALSGSHASPRGIFSVRGHWRHYKSGKAVWIEQYKKGDGKKRNKTYRLGGVDG